MEIKDRVRQPIVNSLHCFSCLPTLISLNVIDSIDTLLILREIQVSSGNSNDFQNQSTQSEEIYLKLCIKNVCVYVYIYRQYFMCKGKNKCKECAVQ